MIGPYAPAGPSRRDRLGEVRDATGGDGPVRLRVTPPSAAPRLEAALPALRALDAPSVAPLLDALVDGEGRVVLVTPADAVTLAERRRRGRLSVEAAVTAGAVLLDGLAALHAAGVAHGSAGAGAAGVDAGGRVRWQDAGVAAALGPEPLADIRRHDDVRRCAAMLRDLARLPAPLEAVVDPVAAGVPGAAAAAAELAGRWRRAAAGLSLAVPPPGTAPPIPGLVEIPARRRRTRRPPRWTARAATGAAVVAAAAIVPVAALVVPGREPLSRPIPDYMPLRAGERLTYRFSSGGGVTLTVRDVRSVAGALTASLVSSRPGASLPLGLGGATLVAAPERATISAAGGGVRLLVSPATPGTSWTDVRSGTVAGLSTQETRTVLGPSSLDEPAGHFDDCVVVDLVARARSTVASGSSGRGSLWYCRGVGLARAVLRPQSFPEVDIDLVSAR